MRITIRAVTADGIAPGYASEGRRAEICAGEVRAIQMCASQIGVAELRPTKIRIHE
jgi:hypothetical protein